MKRILASIGMSALLALLVGISGADRKLPETPAALKEFVGTLHGVVEEVVRGEPDFTGLILRIEEAIPAAGTELAGDVAGARVAIRVVPERDSGPELIRTFAQLTVGQRVVAQVRPVKRLLQASQLYPTTAPAGSPYTSSEGMIEIRRMAVELKALRRELSLLQRDVAELRALALELSRRTAAASR